MTEQTKHGALMREAAACIKHYVFVPFLSEAKAVNDLLRRLKEAADETDAATRADLT